MNFFARKATEHDLIALCTLAEDFVRETKWGYTFSLDSAKNSFLNYIYCDETDVLVVVNETGIIFGLALVALDHEFHNERIGYVSKFYIAPEGRGMSAGRVLASACCDWFDNHDCITSHATQTGNIGQDKAFENLLSKFGFTSFGNSLVRECANVKI